MAISVAVPKNLSGIKTKVAMNLTKRQLICFGAAGAVGIPFYIFTKDIIGTQASALIMVAVMLPFFFLAMYEKDGFPAEKILYFMIRQKFLTPGIRPYKSENLYNRLEEQLPADFKAKISVTVDPEAKTLTFTDNGLGMTADEVEEYICQIAFSGATDFIQKYKDKSTDDQIIGHFGLGFYSAFMVADEVEIDTLSYKEGATPVHWTCDGGTDYELTDGTKTTIGTQITLHLNEDCLEFANEYRAREVIEKYCSFMPTEIYLSKANAEPEYETIDAADKRDTDTVVEEIHEEAKTEEKENENGEKETVEISPAKD